MINAPGTSTVYAVITCRARRRPRLLRSDDAGRHWRLAATLGSALSPAVYGIVATSPSTLLGVRAGHPQHLVRSRDGGRSWQRAGTLPPHVQLFDATASTTYVWSAGRIGALSASGRMLPGPPGRDPSLLHVSGRPDAAVAVGWVADAGAREPALSVTADRGRTWRSVASPPVPAWCLPSSAAIDRRGRVLLALRPAQAVSCGGGVVWVSAPLVAEPQPHARRPTTR
jgi:hypothetical protein